MKRFFGFVEIKTKIVSIFPFLLTAAWLFVKRQPMHWPATATFFVSMFSFDFTTTAINNYIDSGTDGQILPYRRGVALAVLLALLALSIVSGLYLVYLTDAIVLLTGIICFGFGIFYTYGPVPISRTPFGEIVSGILYGFFIPFLILYINNPGTLLTLQRNGSMLNIGVNAAAMMKLVLFSAIPALTTANIMLANNICDVQKDILVKRYTLPYYIGDKARYLFAALYYLCYIDVIVMVLLHILSPVCLLFLLTWFTVQRNIKTFVSRQEKSVTFILSIRNYVVINGAMAVLIFSSRFAGWAK